jgi:signal transduction histidine kinase
LTTWILLRAQELQALDRRLTTDARELFRDIENFQGTNKRRDVTERFVPLALRDRLIEVRGPHGDILYISPDLSEPVLSDGIETFHTRNIEGKAVRIGVFRDQELTLHVGAELKDIEQLGWEIARSLVVVIPIVLLLIAAGSWWLGSVALKPIEDIRRAAEHITAERLDERIPSHGPSDELGRLIDVLNATFERLQASFEQAARFSADASHQLKTPIAVLRAGIEEILAQPRLSEEHRESVANAPAQFCSGKLTATFTRRYRSADIARDGIRPAQFAGRKLGRCPDPRRWEQPSSGKQHSRSSPDEG